MGQWAILGAITTLKIRARRSITLKKSPIVVSFDTRPENPRLGEGRSGEVFESEEKISHLLLDWYTKGVHVLNPDVVEDFMLGLQQNSEVVQASGDMALYSLKH